MIARTEHSPPEPERPDGPLPPSVLCLLCSGEQPPQPLEVLGRLHNAEFEVVREEPDEVEGPILWARRVLLADCPEYYSISVEPREESFCPWNWCNARWENKEQYERAQQSRWLVVIETFLDPEQPHESFHHQLLVTAAIGEGLAEACYDDESFVLRSMTTLGLLADSQVPPSPLEMFQIQWNGDEQGSWMHTHGLRRFDLPDLEILGLGPQDADCAWEAIAWLSAYLLGHPLPSEGGPVQFGEDLEVVLRPAEELWKMLDEDDPGGARDRDADHTGWRMALTDPAPTGDGPRPARLLDKVGSDAVFWLSPYETQRRSDLAQERFALAATAFYSKQFSSRNLLVKLAVATANPEVGNDAPSGAPPVGGAEDAGAAADAVAAEEAAADGVADVAAAAEVGAAVGSDAHAEPGAAAETTSNEEISHEHMWFRVDSVGKGVVRGELLNEPAHVAHLSKGATCALPIDQITDWTLAIDGEDYTPETIGELDLVTFRNRWQDEDETTPAEVTP